jgi:hypothetical protein
MPSPEELEQGLATSRRVVLELLDRWDSGSEAGWNVPAHLHATARMVIPWANQVHRFGRAFLQIEGNYEHEGHVLARSALEYAVVGHWASHVGDNAVLARYGQDQRKLKALVKDLERTRRDVVPTQWKAEMFAEAIDDDPPPAVDEQKLIDDFEEICKEIGSHNNLYPSYRMLCWITHPTLHAANVYVDDSGGILMTPRYREERPMGLVSLIAFCVYWSARTVDDLTIDSPNAKWLDSIAELIDVIPRLPAPRGTTV